MLGWLLVVVFLVVLWYIERRKGVQAIREHRKELEELKQGDNYRRLVRLDKNGREFIARVRKWNIEDKPGQAELWCLEGPNPNGWTKSFYWNKDEIEFI